MESKNDGRKGAGKMLTGIIKYPMKRSDVLLLKQLGYNATLIRPGVVRITKK